MVLVEQWGAPKRHDRVPNKFIHRAQLLFNRIGYQGEIRGYTLQKCTGRGYLRYGGEILQIGKHDGQVSTFTPKLNRVARPQQIVDQITRNVRGKSPEGAAQFIDRATQNLDF